MSSGDYGDFVVSESMRANDRFCINIVVTTAVLHFVASCNMRSFVTTSSDYGKFLSGTGLVTGAILRRCCHRHIKTNQYCSLNCVRARPMVDRLATDCSDYGFYA